MAAPTVGSSRALERTAADPARLLRAAAALLGVAAGIHVLVSPEHLREWLPAGVFFILVAAGQASLAAALLRRPGPLTLLASIWSSVAVIGVYVWSRTAGLPFGPVHHGATHTNGGQQGHSVGGHGNGVPVFPNTATPSRVEPVGALDMAALGAELAVVALLVYLLPARSRRWTGNAILACGALMWLLRATTALS